MNQNQLDLVKTETSTLSAATHVTSLPLPGLARWVGIRSCGNSVFTAFVFEEQDISPVLEGYVGL